MNIKVGVISLGCPKNTVDSEIMLGVIGNTSMTITNKVEEADVIIVNTCGFIESAKQESIDTIIEMCQYKTRMCKKVIVTGCLAKRYYDELKEQMPEVDYVMKLGNFNQIDKVIDGLFNNTEITLNNPESDITYLNDRRMISTGKAYAYVKISEGCDNNCTYCAIPAIRGRYRSRTIDDIEKEVSVIAKEGIKEIILVAQDTTRYGVDIYKEKKLVLLIQKLSQIEGIEWIRLMYCYPEEITDDLINEIAQNPKVVKYIDMPVQHTSDNILKSMGRKGRFSLIKKVISNLRKSVKGIVIRTTLIVGFPGETDKDFEHLAQAVSKLKFDKLGVFEYSKEDGTIAAKMKNQIKKAVKKTRLAEIMSLQQKVHIDKTASRLGKKYKIIVDGVAEDGIFYLGRSYMEAPEIDNSIYFTSHIPLQQGEFVYVKILNQDNYDLIGVLQNEFTK